MKKRRVVFYYDEKKDDFAGDNITPKKIDENYKYNKGSSLVRFFWYRMIATPIAYLYIKLVFGQRTVGAEKLEPYKDRGYFIYGNHTHNIADACIPNLLNVRQKNYIIVHPNNVSMPVLGKITPYLGALPLPDNRAAYANFNEAIKMRTEEGSSITIYPEAHVWPYYTGIREFDDASFSYPVKHGAPVFCFTNTYQKRAHGGRPRIVTYVDGPFFADSSRSVREQRRELRDRVIFSMRERAKNSNVNIVEYVKRENIND